MQVFSLLNYVGHKSKLLDKILPEIPTDISGTFWDIFCGSSVVGLSVPNKNTKFVDNNQHIIQLYNNLTDSKFHSTLEVMLNEYNLTNSSKVPRSEYLKSPDIGTCMWHGKEIKNLHLDMLNKKGYDKLLIDFNNGVFDTDNVRKSCAYLIATLYGRNSNVSVKSDGKLQGAVGPLDFSIKANKKLKEHIEVISSKNCLWISDTYLNIKPEENDFVYLDPPYLASSFKYGGWTEKDENNLLDWISNLKCRWMLSNVIVSGDETNKILVDWSKQYKVLELNKTYRKWAAKGKSSAQKNIKENLEVIIKNY